MLYHQLAEDLVRKLDKIKVKQWVQGKVDFLQVMITNVT